MKLSEILSQKKSDILERWLEAIVNSYHADTRRFLTRRKDQFANPVGYELAATTERLFQLVVDEKEISPEMVTPILDNIIRIRSIQDFSASESVSFVFLLKKAIRGELKEEISVNSLSGELLEFETRIDDLMLIAFDIHMKCREKIYEIKTDMIKRDVSQLLKKSGLISEVPEWDEVRPDQPE